MGLALAITLLSFSGLAWLVQANRTMAFDVAILSRVNDISGVGTDIFFSFITNLGDPLFVLPFGLIITALLLRRDRPAKALLVAVLFAGSGIITSLVKSWLDRIRPDLWYHATVETSFSFPSGHATGSAIVALTLLWLSWHRPKLRRALLMLLPLYVISVSLSRLFLGVHYPTDLLGGWLVATGWFLFVLLVVRLTRPRPRVGNNLR